MSVTVSVPAVAATAAVPSPVAQRSAVVSPAAVSAVAAIGGQVVVGVTYFGDWWLGPPEVQTFVMGPISRWEFDTARKD